MIDLARLRGLADAYAAIGRRDECLRLHATMSELQQIAIALDRLNEALDRLGSPAIGKPYEPLSDWRCDA
jgi:hypothetical protein